MTPARYAASAALLLAGCGQHVSGIVRDAATDRPLAGAVIELRNTGWGFREGQLVWDAEKISRVTTGADGRFEFDEDGGVNLRVRALRSKPVDASLCPRSPMVVRVGGPYPDLRADRRLLLGTAARSEDPRAATAKSLGLTASGSALGDGFGLRMEAEGGIHFVEGTGAIPPPPPLPYGRVVDLDLRYACGWMFVSDGASAIAVIQVGGIAWEQDPGGARRWVMLYTPLSH